MENNKENNQKDTEDLGIQLNVSDSNNPSNVNIPNAQNEEQLDTKKTEQNLDEHTQLKPSEELAKKQEKLRESEAYNYDIIPPNVNKAKIHGRARRVYANISEAERHALSSYKTKKLCGCCGNPYDLENIGIFCAKSELYHLGAGFPLYFEFINFCGVLIIIMLVISGGYNFATNLIGEDCENNLLLERKDSQFCDPSRISLTSLVNKRYSTDELEISNWLNLAAVVVMLLAFHYHRRQSIFTNREIDDSQQTPADYTITITNLPEKVTDEQIKDFFNKELFFNRKIEIVKIVRGYNIRDYVLLNRRKADIQLQLLKKDAPNRDKLESELVDVKKSIDILEKESANNLQTSPYAYITFEKEEEAEEAIRRLAFSPGFKKLFYKLGCYSCFDDVTFQGRKLVAHRAPEPSDILWENLGTAKSEKTKRRFLTFFVSYLLIAICFGIIIGLNVGKDRLSNPSHIEDTNQTKSRSVGIEIISLIIAFVIMVINNALNFLIRRFSVYESHSTFTDYFISVARTLTTVTFINTAITLLVTHIILQNYWKDGGLLNDVFIVFLITVIVGPLSNLFNPSYFYQLYKRYKIEKDGSACTLTQREANLVFEGPPIDIAQAYANALKTIWLTAFYAPVLPIGIPISLVGIFISYWTDKYLLLNRYAKPSELGKSLSQWMTEYLELTPFFFSLGNLIFRRLIKNGEHEVIDDPFLPTILALGISLVHFIIPLNPITRSCFSNDETHSYKKPYSEMRVFFNNDYDISNPIYHDDAIENWLQALEQANQGNQSVLKNQLRAEIKRDPQAENPQLRKLNFFNNIRNYAQMHQGLSFAADHHAHGPVPGGPLNFYHHLSPNPARLMTVGQPIVSHQTMAAKPQHPYTQVNAISQPMYGYPNNNIQLQPQTNPPVNLNFKRPPTLGENQNPNPYYIGTQMQMQNQPQPQQPNVTYNPYTNTYMPQAQPGQQRYNPQPIPNQWQYQGAPYGQARPQNVQAQLPQQQLYGNQPVQQFNPQFQGHSQNQQKFYQN